MRKLFSILTIIAATISGSAQETAEQKDAKRRMFIDDFLATYEAAYEKKEIGFIESFFSDDALIITETKKLKPAGSKEIVPSTQKSRPYKTIVENRKEYIRRLRDIFNSNTSIKLSIAGKKVRQHAKYPEIYGINFTQLWKDQNGGDNLESQMPGFVFLMIDFKHSEMTPTIHVRTWQPKDNIEKEQDKYFLRDFMIYETK